MEIITLPKLHGLPAAHEVVAMMEKFQVFQERNKSHKTKKWRPQNHLKNGAIPKSHKSRKFKIQNKMENKFLTFIKPYLSYIDNGQFFRKPLSWLYTLLAIVNLLIPIYVFYIASKSGIFNSPAKFVIVFLLLWMIIVFAGWVSFQLWWDRKSRINMSSTTDDEFIATPALSHLIQTFGEWIGTWIGLVGFGFALLTTIILGKEGYYLGENLGIPYLSTGWIAILTMPITGFLIIVFSRFLAEQIKALSAIANNTKK
ncbi:MAG: hypothetical protein Q4G63_07090 [Bacteroidia bacterium]|nr:hypothetical protein [Bacteroidia bacterium]